MLQLIYKCYDFEKLKDLSKNIIYTYPPLPHSPLPCAKISYVEEVKKKV
jgi:hypothetical protein